MRTMTAQQLQSYLQSAETRPVLLDVREPQEFAHCHIEGSVNIPMNTVPARLSELAQEMEIITVCHHGMRSGAIAEFLLSRGYLNITNLQGGIDAWAVQVDPKMPRY
jgi:rhodanese-related sulfurtransferase